jgi:hypothetical protein
MEADLEYLMERGGSEKEIEGLRKLIERGGAVSTVIEGIEIFGYVCLGNVIPPEMLKLLDPEKMIEAVHTGDENAIAQAIETSEATPFKSLNAAFWVWLITIMSQIFGPGYGIEQSEAQEAREEEEAERISRMRRIASKKPRKKRKKKAPAKGA